MGRIVKMGANASEVNAQFGSGELGFGEWYLKITEPDLLTRVRYLLKKGGTTYYLTAGLSSVTMAKLQENIDGKDAAAQNREDLAVQFRAEADRLTPGLTLSEGDILEI